MEKELPTTTDLRDRIDAHVTHISAWTTALKALDQKSLEIIEIPSTVMGEIAGSIQRSVLSIQELVDTLCVSDSLAAK